MNVSVAKANGLCRIIPTRGMVDYRAMDSWYRLHMPRNFRQGFAIQEDIEGIGPDNMRNKIIAEVRAKTNPEWFLCIDDDMILPPDAAVRMLEAGEKIVAGVCAMRRHGETACIIPDGQESSKLDWKIGDRIYGATGAGCMLIHRDVIEEMRSPWFYLDGETDEGIAFCYKARELGFRCLVDTEIQCGHVDVANGRRVLWTRQYRNAVGG